MNLQKRLNEAINNNDTELIKSILDEGPNLNAIDEFNETPLLKAVYCDSEEILEMILNHGADINAKDKAGNTALHIAVDNSIDGTIQSGGGQGDEPTTTIMILIRHGADLNAKNNDGKTPLDWAKSYMSKKIIDLLNSTKS